MRRDEVRDEGVFGAVALLDGRSDCALEQFAERATVVVGAAAVVRRGRHAPTASRSVSLSLPIHIAALAANAGVTASMYRRAGEIVAVVVVCGARHLPRAGGSKGSRAAAHDQIGGRERVGLLDVMAIGDGYWG
jgi:hypothetical protein